MEIQSGFEFSDDQFDPEAYWGTREVKVWVVTLYHPVRRGRRGRRAYNVSLKYVRARTREGAVKTARANYFGKEKVSGASARLATPTDLGATATPTN